MIGLNWLMNLSISLLVTHKFETSSRLWCEWQTKFTRLKLSIERLHSPYLHYNHHRDCFAVVSRKCKAGVGERESASSWHKVSFVGISEVTSRSHTHIAAPMLPLKVRKPWGNLSWKEVLHYVTTYICMQWVKDRIDCYNCRYIQDWNSVT